MAQNTSYNWPVQNLQAICKTQDVAARDNLILNGTMAVTGSEAISFIRSGFSRSVSIKAGDHDLSGVQFTVTGMQNGGRIEENITGPQVNETIYTTKIFDVITSVSVDKNVVEVQIGTGKTGFLPLLNADPNSTRFNIRNTNGAYSILMIPMHNNTPMDNRVTYNVWGTLENIDNNGLTFKSQLGRFFSLIDAVSANTKSIIHDNVVLNYILVEIIDVTDPDQDSFDFIYMQS